MDKHTPGPWVVRNSGNGYPSWINAPNEDPNRPGGITAITRRAAISCPALLEGQANARLMAAAPDLLAALELCADGLEFGNGHVPESDPTACGGCIALKAARDAIAKARGAV